MATNIKLNRVYAQLNDKKVYYDPSFQRRVVWDPKDTSILFESLSRGWVKSPISLADVESCLFHSEEVGDEVSAEYFRDLDKKGYRYVSIDGQNRTKRIIEVMQNKHTLSGENFADQDGKTISKVDNKYLKDLEKDLTSDHFQLATNLKSQAIPVHVFENVTREQCSEIFRNINRTKQPNPHNIRQSYSTPIASFVRELRNEVKKPLTRILPDFKISEMLDDELIAKSLMILTKKYRRSTMNRVWNLRKEDLDAWYTNGNGFYNFDDKGCPYLLDELERSRLIVKQAMKCIQDFTEDKKTNVKLVQYWGLLSACQWVHDNNYTIIDHKCFYKEIETMHGHLYSSSKMAYTEDVQNALDPDTIQDIKYYFKRCSRVHVSGDRIDYLNDISTYIEEHLPFASLRLLSKKIA